MQLLLCDENLPYPSVKYLREQGHDVKSIIDDNRGITDEFVVAISAEEKRIIITFDSDFGTLIFRNNLQPYGVIYFRWPSFRPREAGL